MTTTLENPTPPDTAEAHEPAKQSPLKLSRRVREVGISALVIAILVISVLSAVPGSAIKAGVAPVLVPVARATGLDQGWGMFAPNPPRANSKIEVHVIMADGSDRVWLPFDDPSMRQMQWRKFKEEIVNGKTYRPALALYAIRQMTKDGNRAARVIMIAEIESIPLPGQGVPVTKRKLLMDRKIPASVSGAQK